MFKGDEIVWIRALCTAGRGYVGELWHQVAPLGAKVAGVVKAERIALADMTPKQQWDAAVTVAARRRDNDPSLYGVANFDGTGDALRGRYIQFSLTAAEVEAAYRELFP